MFVSRCESECKSCNAEYKTDNIANIPDNQNVVVKDVFRTKTSKMNI